MLWDAANGSQYPPKIQDARPLRQTFNDLDQLIGSEPLPSSEFHQLASPDNYCSSLRCACNGHPSSSTELQETFITQETQRAEHGVGVDAQDCSQVSGGRHSFTRSRFSFSDGATDLCGHLFVKSQ